MHVIAFFLIVLCAHVEVKFVDSEPDWQIVESVYQHNTADGFDYLYLTPSIPWPTVEQVARELEVYQYITLKQRTEELEKRIARLEALIAKYNNKGIFVHGYMYR